MAPACCRRVHHARGSGRLSRRHPGLPDPRRVSSRSTVVAALRSARADPVAAIPTGRTGRGFPRMACGKSLHRNQALPTTAGRSSPAGGDLPPRARVLTVGCSTSQARPRIACGVPSRGGCRRCHGSEPDTGMQDIRHITSVLTHRRSGRAIRPGAIAPGIPIPPGCPALALATGPSLGSCADSLRFCVALPAVNVPAS